MNLFLTSSPTGDLDGKYTCIGLDSRNGFADEVRKVWKENAKILMISAFPDDKPANDEMRSFFHDAVLKTNLSCSQFDLWDSAVLEDESLYTKEVLHSYDVIFLGGGHVPTQQAYFEKLHLRESMIGFDGIVIGISAGTMNCADVVYSQPEEPGEALDPNYRRFFPGLNLTKINVLPHYQLTKNIYKDGKHLYREITLPNSYGKQFISLIDGSFIVEADGERTVYGEAYMISDGNMWQICEYGKHAVLLPLQINRNENRNGNRNGKHNGTK